jgi:5-methylcytosine-specific restriction endonuclease McrA
MSKQISNKAELKNRLLIKTNYRCAYCGCELDYNNSQIDHVIPKRRGSDHIYHSNFNKPKGSDEEYNLMACCGSCNSSKSDLDLEDFRERVLDRVTRLNDYSTEYNIAKRFGLVKEIDIPVIFYFEKLI